MRSPKAQPIQLSNRQRSILEQLARQRSGPHQLVVRAQIILAASDGQTNAQIAQALSLNRNTVITWRNRFSAESQKLAATETDEPSDQKALAQQIVGALSDKPRSGTPATFSAEQIVAIVALACEDPQITGRPVSHWTPTELADESQKRGIVSQISPRHVGRFLKSV